MQADIEQALSRWANGESWQQAFMPRRSYRNQIRDQHLKRAGAMIGHDPIELHRLASRFESVLWPRWSRSGMPADAGAINALLYQARQAGPLPSSTRQFRRILK